MANAKSERFLKGNKKKTGSLWAVRGARGACPWAGGARSDGGDRLTPPPVPALPAQTVKKSLATHPLVFLFIFFIMAFSGACAAAGGARSLLLLAQLNRAAAVERARRRRPSTE